MNRKVMKIVTVLLMAMMVVTMLSTSVFAAGESEKKTEDNAETPTVTGWKEIDISKFDTATDQSGATDTAVNILGSIISIVQVIGMGIAIIMLIVMAIKYISAAPSEKADIKKGVTIYVVGAVVLFAASGILGIIKNFASQNIQPSTQASVVMMVDMEDTYLA